MRGLVAKRCSYLVAMRFGTKMFEFLFSDNDGGSRYTKETVFVWPVKTCEKSFYLDPI